MESSCCCKLKWPGTGRYVGLQSLLHTMQAPGALDNADTQWFGCHWLSELALYSTSSSLEQDSKFRRILDEGGLHTVVRAMRRHPDRADVLVQGSRFIAHLSKKAMFSSNVTGKVIAVLVDAMKVGVPRPRAAPAVQSHAHLSFPPVTAPQA